MVTATIDDGWGHGLDIIHRYATVAGVSIHPLGVLRLSEEIVDVCNARRPDILGLTVLQFFSDDDLIHISANLPKKTRIIAGGPVFTADPDFAVCTGVHHVAKNAAAFLELLLSWPPEDKTGS
jgi:methanogenic corrinoid protein MtbC1